MPRYIDLICNQCNKPRASAEDCMKCANEIRKKIPTLKTKKEKDAHTTLYHALHHKALQMMKKSRTHQVQSLPPAPTHKPRN